MTKLTQTMLPTDAKAIEKLCVSIDKRGKTLQADMHKAACAVLLHVGHHGDVRLVTRLISAMPKIARKNALMTWFESFGQITFENGTAKFDKAGNTRLGTALETPFWRFQVAEGGAYTPIDAAARVDAFLKALHADAAKATKAGQTPADHGHLIAALAPFASEVPVQ